MSDNERLLESWKPEFHAQYEADERNAAQQSFDDYWGSAWPSMYDPNYAFTEVVVRVETNVYSLASDELLWSALSRTIDPASSRTVVDEVTTLVAGELSTHGVVVGSRLEAKRAR